MPEPLKTFVTARIYPIDRDTGQFSSSVAETVHEEAAKFGLTRDQTRHLIHAYQDAEERSNKAYEVSTKRCIRCSGSGTPPHLREYTT